MPAGYRFQQPPRPRPRTGNRLRRFQGARPWMTRPYAGQQLNGFEELATRTRGYITEHPLLSVAVAALAGAAGLAFSRRER